ncbi:MAG: cytidylate kinase-like family protein [Ruminococcaceae bacterium]|nr:cytidylate kinase-like family protein [Oscillospiraceae bacterium]
MGNNFVVTIGREFGSGGHAIAKMLAEELGVKLYDKELLDIAAKNSGLSAEVLREYDEKPTNSFLYSLSMGAYSYDGLLGTASMPLVDKVFSVQAQIIREIAEKESCVIVGRCAESILSGKENMLSVFIHADIEERARRVMEYENISFEKAFDLVKKSDKKRAGYHNYFSDSKWGDASSYDICIDSKIGFENVVHIIKFCVNEHIYGK